MNSMLTQNVGKRVNPIKLTLLQLLLQLLLRIENFLDPRR